jgi:hypothetical protein
LFLVETIQVKLNLVHLLILKIGKDCNFVSCLSLFMIKYLHILWDFLHSNEISKGDDMRMIGHHLDPLDSAYIFEFAIKFNSLYTYIWFPGSNGCFDWIDAAFTTDLVCVNKLVLQELLGIYHGGDYGIWDIWN